MTFQQLRCFVSAAKFQSFHQAARYLYISQPAVSHQISQLEKELGVQLFDRSLRNAVLTNDGKQFFLDAVDILDRIDLAVQRMQNKNHSRHLQIVLESSLQISLLPQLLSRFHQQMPEVSVNITSVVQVTEQFLLENDPMDLAFCSSSFFHHEGSLQTTELFQSRQYCIVPEGHLLSTESSLTFSQLKGYNFIFPDNTHCPPDTRRFFHRFLKQTEKCSFSYSSTPDQACTMVKAGFGIAIMPEFIIPTCSGIQKILITDSEPVSVLAVWKPLAESAESHAFLKLAKEIAKEYSHPY